MLRLKQSSYFGRGPWSHRARVTSARGLDIPRDDRCGHVVVPGGVLMVDD